MDRQRPRRPRVPVCLGSRVTQRETGPEHEGKPRVPVCLGSSASGKATLPKLVISRGYSIFISFDVGADHRHWSQKKLQEMTGPMDWLSIGEDFKIKYRNRNLRAVPLQLGNLTRDLFSVVDKVMAERFTIEQSSAGDGRKSQGNVAEEEAGVLDSAPASSPVSNKVSHSENLALFLPKGNYEIASHFQFAALQMAAIPLGLVPGDLIVTINNTITAGDSTYSGKHTTTASFVLHMLTCISKLPTMKDCSLQQDNPGPYAIVLAPTIDLCRHIEDEILMFSHPLGIKVVSLVGESHQCLPSSHIVIATPQHISEYLQTKEGLALLNQCCYLALDHADQMIDLGFEQQVIQILDAMPWNVLKQESKQGTTSIFTSSLSPGVQRLSDKYLKSPVALTINAAATRRLLPQHVVLVENESEKLPYLLKLINDLQSDEKALIFVNTKQSADSLSNALAEAGFRVATLHRDMLPQQRETSLFGFRDQRFNILVTTEVAGRAVPFVAQLITYDRPPNIHMYTHRIQRQTSPADIKAVATTILTSHDSAILSVLRHAFIQTASCVGTVSLTSKTHG